MKATNNITSLDFLLCRNHAHDRSAHIFAKSFEKFCASATGVVFNERVDNTHGATAILPDPTNLADFSNPRQGTYRQNVPKNYTRPWLGRVLLNAILMSSEI